MAKAPIRSETIWEVACKLAGNREEKDALHAMEKSLSKEERNIVLRVIDKALFTDEVKKAPIPLDKRDYFRENYVRLSYKGRSKPASERTVKIHQVKGYQIDPAYFDARSFVATDGTGPAKTFLFSNVLKAWDEETGEIFPNFQEYVVSGIVKYAPKK